MKPSEKCIRKYERNLIQKLDKINWTGFVFESELHSEEFYERVKDKVRYFKSKGLFHREDGPAKIKEDETVWYLNGKIGRLDDLPSSITKDGIKTWCKNGEIHRGGDKPAIINPEGTKEWYKEGKRHRIGAPAIQHHDGDVEWWENGHRHRIDGPAIDFNLDKKWVWYYYGKKHREDGPAEIEYNSLDKYHLTEKWFLFDKLHREDGPAVINYDEDRNVIDQSFYYFGEELKNEKDLQERVRDNQ